MARLAVVALALSLAFAGSAVGTGAQSRKLVSYVHSGGLAGEQDSLTVFRSGKANSSNGPFGLSTRRLLTLEAALRGARFATLQAQYLPAEPIADGYVERVLYAGRTVSVAQGAKPPVRLQHVLGLLADILARKR
jgi:hypothetical protein